MTMLSSKPADAHWPYGAQVQGVYQSCLTKNTLAIVSRNRLRAHNFYGEIMTVRSTTVVHLAFLLIVGGLLLACYLAAPAWPSLARVIDLLSVALMAVPGSTALLLVPTILPEALAEFSALVAAAALTAFVGLFAWVGWHVAAQLTQDRTGLFLFAFLALACLNIVVGRFAMQAAAWEGWARLGGIVPAFPMAAAVAALGLAANGLFYTGWWLFMRRKPV